MSIRTYGGQWLLAGSGVATAGDCCCDDPPPPPPPPPVPCPDGDSDCPNYGLPCEDFFPGVPYNCCDGECEPHACYPGAQITLNFIKKSGCFAPFLSGIAEGSPFSAVIGGGSLSECGALSASLSSAPCVVEWVLGEGCEVTELTFSDGGIPFCEQCYDFQGWTSCRTDCAGDCV